MANPYLALIRPPKGEPEVGIRSGSGNDLHAIPFPQVEHVCNNLAQMPGCVRVEVEANNVNAETGAFELFAAAYGEDGKVFDRRAIKPGRTAPSANLLAEVGHPL
jgi:hypothetical protein